MKLRYWIIIGIFLSIIAVHAVMANSIDGGIQLLINNITSLTVTLPILLLSTVTVWMVVIVGTIVCITLVILTAKWTRLKQLLKMGKRVESTTGLPPLQVTPVNTIPQQVYPNVNLQPLPVVTKENET